MKRIFLILAALCVPTILCAQDNAIAVRPNGQHTLSFSATPIFDFSAVDSIKITLTGNVSSSTMVGMEPGQFVKFEICQDGVGSRTFAWPSQVQNPTSISASAGVCTLEVFNYDGTNAYPPPGSGGSGSGTVSNSGTSKLLALYASSGTTVSGDTNLDDGGTTANTLTYAGTGGVAAINFTSTGTGGGGVKAKEGAVPSPAATFDFLVGDSVSHSMQLSNNGNGFQSLATNCSTSPTTHGVSVGGGFPCYNTVPTGNIGQPLLSGGSSADPGYGPLNLAGGATFVIGTLPSGNLPATIVYTGQANTYSSGLQDFSAVTFKVPITAGAAPATNGLVQYDSTSNNFHGGLNGADSRFASFVNTPTNLHCVHWVNTGGNITLADDGSACGAGASVAWTGVTAGSGGATTDNGDSSIVYRTLGTTSGRIGWRETETSASSAAGTPWLHQIDTASGSTMNPLQVCASGTSNCWQFLKTGVLTPAGSAALAAPGSNGQLLFNNSGVVAAEDPIVSQAYVNLFSAVAATGTATSSAVRNPVFSQTGTLQITWASITGSPSGCTLQMQGVDSLGNALNDGSTFSVTPSNGTTSQTFTAASTLQTAAQVKAIYACSVYPGAGTLSLDFTPFHPVTVTNTVPVTGTFWQTTQPVSGTFWQATQPVSGTFWQTTQPVSGTFWQTTQPVSCTTANCKVETTGNAGAAFDQAPGSAVPANAVMMGVSDGTDTRFINSDPTGRPLVRLYGDTATASFHASKKFAASSTTDNAVFPGNATNTALLTRVIVTCTQTTAGTLNLELVKRSAADTSGTSASMTAVPDDANYSGAVSAPLSYTGTGPSAGAAIGDLDNGQVGCNAAATAGPNDIYIFKPAKPIVLRGTAQQVAINLGGAVTGGTITVTFEWIETTTP